ncbi:FG-GAP-like repeat-containing protein [Planktosalinus lacus]|uniref:RNA-binding protein n=1 Tax=Planktosalinus lacus TaxID=1526573 RepID=A0A8J2V3F2_9FLAO|nr:FG-GAP-like repeat-containing protein [Planktosalinus lacus]GGD80603.1 hypothetical protein GCM10011312_01070 [Planktosalinus lacus]
MKSKITLLIIAFLSINTVFSQISFTTENIDVTGQYKICAVDMNGDYLDDIVSVSGTNINIHFQNENGTFTPQDFNTTPADNLPSWSLSAGDYTGNGYNDLIYGSSSGVTFMRANNNGTAYTEVSFPEFVFVQRTNFVDINNDGNLDAFACHDIAPNVYFINDGNGNLEFNQGGLGDVPVGGHYGSLWVDYNNDGNLDLFIAKCSGGGQGATAKFNELHRNNGDGTFTDVSVESGLRDAVQTWSSAWGDFDNDGFMDVLVGASSFSDGGHKLMRNNGDGTFTDITAGSGFDTFGGTSIEHATYDFNNDGYLDIFGNSNTLFINNGDFTFTTTTIPFSGAAIADLNNDGFLDAFQGNEIHYNSGNNNNWIVINTQGVESNRNGIGARIEIVSALGTQIRDVRSGEGFRFMSTLNTHFGIGQDTEIEQLIVRWPSGTIDVIENPEINTTHLIVEGQTLSVEENRLFDLTLSPNPVKDILALSTRENLIGAQAQIYDMSGRLVFSETLNSSTIDVSKVSSGVYVLNLDVNDQKAAIRFVKY